MKRTVSIVWAVCWSVGLGALCSSARGAEEASDLLFRHQFVGVDAIEASPEASKLREVFGLAESNDYAESIRAKLATAPFRRCQAHLPDGASDQGELFAPLISDLFSEESVSEIRGGGDRLELVLSVRLEDDRAAVWSTNLWQVLAAWEAAPRSIQVGDFSGWQSRLGGQVLQLVRARDWVVFGLGAEQLNLLPEVLGKIKAGEFGKGRPEKLLLSGWVALNRWPLLRQLSLESAEFAVASDEANLRTTGDIRLARPLTAPLGGWEIPTNSIPDSVVSFFCFRGLASLVQDVSFLFSKTRFSKPIDQVVGWGPNLRHSGYLYMAAPVADPTNEIRRVSVALPEELERLLTPQMGKFAYASNVPSLSMIGLPYVFPFLKPLEEGGHSYLQFGMFPTAPPGQSAPEELLEQLAGRDDLVYYGWEITQSRLFHSRQTYQLGDIVRGKYFSPLQDPDQRWVTAVAPLLGNTVTEISLAEPRRLSFTRKSHLGLSGFEIMTLVRWIEADGFPWRWGPRPDRTPLVTPEQIKKAQEEGRAPAQPNPIPGVSPRP